MRQAFKEDKKYLQEDLKHLRFWVAQTQQLLRDSPGPYRLKVFQGKGKTCCIFIILYSGKQSSFPLYKH